MERVHGGNDDLCGNEGLPEGRREVLPETNDRISCSRCGIPNPFGGGKAEGGGYIGRGAGVFNRT